MAARRPTVLDMLSSRLESLPLYETLNQNSDEQAVFNEEQEPSSGLINLIRRNSYLEDDENISSTDVVSILIKRRYFAVKLLV